MAANISIRAPANNKNTVKATRNTQRLDIQLCTASMAASGIPASIKKLVSASAIPNISSTPPMIWAASLRHLTSKRKGNSRCANAWVSTA